MSGHRFTAPGLPRAAVDRPRLETCLSELFARSDIVEVIAAAGSGKTVLAEQYGRRSSAPLSWLTLNQMHRSGRRLLDDLATSLAAVAPHAAEEVSRASAMGLTLVEAAAVLADAVESPDSLLVLDNCEVVIDADEARGVLSAFLEPMARPCVLLLSREELDFGLAQLRLRGRASRVSDLQLAMTRGEANELFSALGRSDSEVDPLMVETGGWVAGLVFRSHRRGLGDGPDQLSAYLNAEVLERLPNDEQAFLLDTSLLDEVTLDASTWLCGDQSAAMLARLRDCHVPATNRADGSMIYHSCFRAFLADQLAIRRPERRRSLVQRHAEWLQRQGQGDDAVEALLSIDDLDGAADAACGAIDLPIERADWTTILRWLERIGPARARQRPTLVASRIRALASSRRIPEVQQLVSELHASGDLPAVVAAQPSVVAHIGWAFVWRPREALALLDGYEGDFRAAGVRYAIESIAGEDPVVPPPGRDWGDVERFFCWALLVQGRLLQLRQSLPDIAQWPPPGHYYWSPHALLGLVWEGQVERARELWEIVPVEVRQRAHTDLWYYLEAWMLLAEGDPAAALEAGERAVSHSQHTSFGWEPLFEVVVGRALLDLGRVADARAVLMDAYRRSSAAGERAYAEQAQTLLGLTLLRQGIDQEARRALRDAVSSMTRARRLLFLPMAAVYLAEAEWRAGDVIAANAAAATALSATGELETLAPISRALLDVPGVQERHGSLGTELPGSNESASSRARPRMDATARPLEGSPVVVQTCGIRPGVLVEERFHEISRTKVMEFVALLARSNGELDRVVAQRMLLPDNDQRSGGNYFRQIVHQFRRLTGLSLERVDAGRLRLTGHQWVDSTDQRLERLLDPAVSESHPPSYEQLEAAVRDTEGGYLPQSDLEWAEARRFEFDVLRARALVRCATMATEAGAFDAGRDFVERALSLDPFAEDAWRELMRLEGAAGSPSGVRVALQRFRTVLAELGLEPSDATLQLANALHSRSAAP